MACLSNPYGGKTMGKTPLIDVSICVAVLLALGSLSNVIGCQYGITNSTMGQKGSRDDTTPPVTTCSLYPTNPNGKDGWYITMVMVTLNATDDDSGVNVTYYQINDGGWTVYTSLIELQEGGYIVIRYYSVDNAGNIEVQKEAKIKIDFSPPMTSMFLPPPNGENGWYISDFSITLNATDDWSGVDLTYYKANGHQWQVYTDPFDVYTNGEIACYSTDKAGNQETSKSVIIKMDTTPPQIFLNYTWEGNPWHGYEFIFTATCTDSMSGMDKVEFYLNDEVEYVVTGPGPTYVWNYSSTPLPSVIVKAIAYDMAGLTNSAEIINPHSDQSHYQFMQHLPLHHQKMNLLQN